jgi:hypothetical protein
VLDTLKGYASRDGGLVRKWKGIVEKECRGMVLTSADLATDEADQYDEGYEEAWRNFVREKQYIDAREMEMKRKERELRERAVECERKEKECEEREAKVEDKERMMKVERKGFDKKLLNLLTSYGGEEVAEEVKATKKRRTEGPPAQEVAGKKAATEAEVGAEDTHNMPKTPHARTVQAKSVTPAEGGLATAK